MNHFYQNIDGWFDFEDLYSHIVNSAPNTFKFAEVGVWKGKSLAYFIVEAINSNKNFEAYAIDTWAGSLEHMPNMPAYDPLLQTTDGLYLHFLNNLSPVQEKIKIIRKKSVDAAKDFPDEYFDTVFIDASHEYIDVINDITTWWPKIKSGHKKMYGHDYHDDWAGVKKAVQEFASNSSLNFKPISKTCWTIFE
jgi:hypothetical protein